MANAAVSGIVPVCAAVFMVTYHRRAPWRSSGMGWYLMVFVATIGLLGSYTIVMTVLGPHGLAASAMRIIRACLLLTVAGLLLQGARAVRRAQRRS
ncbi:putative phage holin [Streptomyces sediminimaris]|uniref:putative phage holin n=1 Tax=Streptomyces sediminimaris TaxID=3383721 RepID=UPI00399B17B7